jgi:hypothetical protein
MSSVLGGTVASPAGQGRRCGHTMVQGELAVGYRDTHPTPAHIRTHTDYIPCGYGGQSWSGAQGAPDYGGEVRDFSGSDDAIIGRCEQGQLLAADLVPMWG